MSCTRSIKDVFHYLVWGAFDSVNGAGIDHEKLMIQFVLVSYRENKFSIDMLSSAKSYPASRVPLKNGLERQRVIIKQR